MEENAVYDVIIIGAGPAGLTAAIYACRSGLSALVLESAASGGQVAISSSVENYPSIEKITGWELAENMRRHALSCGAKLVTADVSEARKNGSLFESVTKKGIFTSRTLIIANGVKRRKLGCPGEAEFTGKGVSYCATCDGMFFRGKRVAVVGGGDTAAQDALYLANICEKVTLIVRKSEMRCKQSLLDSCKNNPDIDILYNTQVRSVNGNIRVESISLISGETESELEVSGVFIAIGLSPDNARFAGLVSLDENGYIDAYEDCLTATDGVFAAGDTRRKSLRQIVTAAADGAVAASQALKWLQGGSVREN